MDPEAIRLLTGVNIVEKSVLSPAKAEKAGMKKEFVNQLVDRPFLGQKLIRRDANDVATKIFGKKE
jgi:hypothetical protein